MLFNSPRKVNTDKAGWQFRAFREFRSSFYSASCINGFCEKQAFFGHFRPFLAVFGLFLMIFWVIGHRAAKAQSFQKRFLP